MPVAGGWSDGEQKQQEEAAPLGSRVLLSAVQLLGGISLWSASNLDADVQEGENFPLYGLLSKIN